MGMIWEVGPISSEILYWSDSGLFWINVINSGNEPSWPSGRPLNSVGNDSASIVGDIEVPLIVLGEHAIVPWISCVLNTGLNDSCLTNWISSLYGRRIILACTTWIVGDSGLWSDGWVPFWAWWCKANTCKRECWLCHKDEQD